MAYVIDSQTGTFFDAEHAWFIDENRLGEHHRDILDSGSDAEIGEMAEELGRNCTADYDALDAITEWLRSNPDQVWLREILARTGRIL
jgi:hypothetical protein